MGWKRPGLGPRRYKVCDLQIPVSSWNHGNPKARENNLLTKALRPGKPGSWRPSLHLPCSVPATWATFGEREGERRTLG